MEYHHGNNDAAEHSQATVAIFNPDGIVCFSWNCIITSEHHSANDPLTQ